MKHAKHTILWSTPSTPIFWSTPSAPFHEARKARKHASTWSTPIIRARKAREHAKHLSTPSTQSMRARHLADSEKIGKHLFFVRFWVKISYCAFMAWCKWGERFYNLISMLLLLTWHLTSGLCFLCVSLSILSAESLILLKILGLRKGVLIHWHFKLALPFVHLQT